MEPTSKDVRYGSAAPSVGDLVVADERRLARLAEQAAELDVRGVGEVSLQASCRLPDGTW
jgi:hypothetical protein